MSQGSWVLIVKYFLNYYENTSSVTVHSIRFWDKSAAEQASKEMFDDAQCAVFYDPEPLDGPR